MRKRRFWLWMLAFAVLLPVLFSAARVATQDRSHWSRSRWDSAGVAPAAATHREAIVQVYAARVYGLRGALGVHTWIALKPEDAERWSRLEVVGWSVMRGGEALRESDVAAPDGYWAGNAPTLLLDRRGPAAAALIPAIRAAARDYPYPGTYVMWPGPNSNSFTAHVARSVPALGLTLPATAIGKDWIGQGDLIGPTPSGTGYQVSLFGLFGVALAAAEGIEVNLLGLIIGVDLARPALKLPGIGRIGLPPAS
jgi:hypothetical protein